MFRLFVKNKLKDSGIKPKHFVEVAERAEKLGVKDFYGNRLVELGSEVENGIQKVELYQTRGEYAQAAIAARRTEHALETIIKIGEVGK